MVRHIIEGFWKDTHLARGYELLYTPHIAKVLQGGTAWGYCMGVL